MAVSCSREPRQNDDFAAMNEEMERQVLFVLLKIATKPFGDHSQCKKMIKCSFLH